jgi:hypothetical protein
MLVIGKWVKRTLAMVTFRQGERIRYDRYSYGKEDISKARSKIRREAKNCGHTLSRFSKVKYEGNPMIMAHCTTPSCYYVAAINEDTFQYTGPDMYQCPLST